VKLITFVSTAALLFATASAAQAAEITPTTAASFEQSLGADGAGTYLQDGKVVVNVTDQAAAEKVEDAGAVAKVVENSDAELNRVEQTIKVAAAAPGMAYAVDPTENKVVVTLDASVSDAERAHVEDVLAGNDAVRIEQTAGTFAPMTAGGDAITGPGARCSLGFNVKNAAGANYILTAGHCAKLGGTWSATGFTGAAASSSFPGNDYGLIRVDSGAATLTGDVDLYGPGRQDITTARNAIVGEPVKRSGSTTRVHAGVVQAVNQTVVYPQGAVSGLIRTNVCAEPGDSGGPLFNGAAALGITSGGSGNCSVGGTTFYQPVTEALAVYGLHVY
jgi:streptogrisin D